MDHSVWCSRSTARQPSKQDHHAPSSVFLLTKRRRNACNLACGSQYTMASNGSVTLKFSTSTLLQASPVRSLVLALSFVSAHVTVAQPEADSQRLAAQIESTFNVRTRVVDMRDHNLLLAIQIPPAETLKVGDATRQAFAHRIAGFARKHFAVGGSAEFISAMLVSVRDSAGTPVPADIGHWYWLTQYLDADSGAVPDLLKGGKHQPMPAGSRPP